MILIASTIKSLEEEAFIRIKQIEKSRNMGGTN